MGNNSSTVQVGHHPIPSKWASIDQDLHAVPSSRLHRAYLPPRHYLVHPPRTHHPLLVQPQHLVLPSKVDPNELKLKSTQNGKILSHGGTISGRRLNEVELSTGSNASSLVRSQKSNMSNGGRASGASTPNLVVACAKEAREKGGRRRDSEPQVQQEQPPTSGKSRIKARKKSSAPAPPPAAASSTELEAKKIGDGILLGSYEKSSQPSQQEELATKKNSTGRLFRTRAEGRPAPVQRRSAGEDELRLEQRRERTTILEVKPKSDQVAAQMAGRAAKKAPPSNSKATPTTASKTSSSSDEDLPPNVEVQKRTFYFGMEEDGGNTMRVRCHQKASAKEAGVNEPSRLEAQAAAVSMTKKDKGDKGAEARDFKKSCSTSEQRPSSRHSERRAEHVKSERPAAVASGSGFTQGSSKPNSEVKGQRSGTQQSRPRPPNQSPQPIQQQQRPPNQSSAVLQQQQLGPHQHHRQDAHQQLQRPPNQSNQVQLGPQHHRQDSGTSSQHYDNKDNSSTDLSSSEMDIPILLRPTLPIKRHELPRFSPSSAWRALDSPPGRSMSSEEGYNFPPPTLRNNAAERSGDSGISAGDSPAVPEAVTPKILKCWTPEQDLDESSDESGDGFGEYHQKPDFDTTSKPSLRRIHQRGRKQPTGGLGGANWFLSRSEPNSLNNLRMMSTGLGSTTPLNFILSTREGERGRADGWEEDTARSMGEFASTTSDIGYGPSSLPYTSYDRALRRPFCKQPMYLPSYDSRQRKTKSVDNLNSAIYKPISRYDSSIQLESQPPIVAVTPTNFAAEAKRKKFKFQSTLRVLERKQMEKQLAEEAREKELERLKEIEQLRAVEEEFERKRGGKSGGAIVRIVPWGEGGAKARLQVEQAPPRSFTPTSVLTGGRTLLSITNQPLAPKSSSSSSGGSRAASSTSTAHLQQRQEPEGAATDLRRELIQASRRRNGTALNSELSTQELSEYKQEDRRQYRDYCSREPRGSQVVLVGGGGSSRLDSPSDFHSRASSQVGRGKRGMAAAYHHPEIVCEIPSSHQGGSSRLGGSTSNLLQDDRSSVHGSGPSSLISDNYRRDWAQKHSTGSSVIQIGGGGSILSLNSNGGGRQDEFALQTRGLPQQEARHPTIQPFQPTPFGSSREYRPVVFRPGPAPYQVG